MVISHSQSHPVLNHHIADPDDHDQFFGAKGSSSPKSLLPTGNKTLRIHSYDDMIMGCIRHGGNDSVDIYFKPRPATSGYVSFEDVINSKVFQEGSGW